MQQLPQPRQNVAFLCLHALIQEHVGLQMRRCLRAKRHHAEDVPQVVERQLVRATSEVQGAQHAFIRIGVEDDSRLRTLGRCERNLLGRSNNARGRIQQGRQR